MNETQYNSAKGRLLSAQVILDKCYTTSPASVHLRLQVVEKAGEGM